MTDENPIPPEVTTLAEDIRQKLQEGLGSRVFLVDPNLTNTLFETVKKNEDLMSHFSERELRLDISNFLGTLHAIPPKNDAEYQKEITNFIESLRNEKEYTAIFILEGVYGIPIGTKIGAFEIINADLTDPSFKRNFDTVLQKYSKFDLKECVWAEIQFKSFKNEGVVNEFYEKAEFLLSILTFLLEYRISIDNIKGLIKSEKQSFFIGTFESMPARSQKTTSRSSVRSKRPSPPG